MSDTRIPRIVVTSGEPAGIGPELCRNLPVGKWPAELVVLGERQLFPDLTPVDWQTSPTAGAVRLAHIPAPESIEPGELNAGNAQYVCRILDEAIVRCTSGDASAIVTAPLHKGVINDAGIPFTGHTEYLADATGTPRVVMMLASPSMRVVLVTTHLPLRNVATAITAEAVRETIRITHHDLVTRFGLTEPRIAVCGLNPHAGEGGHLGDEEITVIHPVLAELRAQRLRITGPLPADTAFTPGITQGHDVIVAMYHDQGLPPLKQTGFGKAINVTLGLPLIRTSVDHGTALDIAGQGIADSGSFVCAIDQALELIHASAP